MTMYRPHPCKGHTFQNLTNFWKILLFMSSNPYLQLKSRGDWFPNARPICQCAGLPISPMSIVSLDSPQSTSVFWWSYNLLGIILLHNKNVDYISLTNRIACPNHQNHCHQQWMPMSCASVVAATGYCWWELCKTLVIESVGNSTRQSHSLFCSPWWEIHLQIVLRM